MRALIAASALLACATLPAAAQGAAGSDAGAPPPPQEIATIVVGQVRTGMLEAGDWAMGDGTWADVWYVQLDAGQQVTIELRSTNFDAYLQFLDPYGAKLAENDDGGGMGSNSRIRYTVRSPGRYQIVVNNYGDTRDTGLYTLSVR